MLHFEMTLLPSSRSVLLTTYPHAVTIIILFATRQLQIMYLTKISSKLMMLFLRIPTRLPADGAFNAQIQLTLLYSTRTYHRRPMGYFTYVYFLLPQHKKFSPEDTRRGGVERMAREVEMTRLFEGYVPLRERTLRGGNDRMGDVSKGAMFPCPVRDSCP